MPIDLTILSRYLEPANTVLIFGAGSSIPSGGMSGVQMAECIARNFKIDYDSSLHLGDVATIVERRMTRRDLIIYLRTLIESLSPTGSILNIPLFNWKSIFTTNYDTLIERAYQRARRDLIVYRSNFDFTIKGNQSATRLYKLHGSIEQDVIDGNNSRIIISNKDYEVTYEYRENLYDALRLEISTGDLMIVGHSLSDPDLKEVVDEALRRKRQAGAPGKVYLLAYTGNRDRALIYEDRGIEVCLAGLDELFGALDTKLPEAQLALSISDDPLHVAPDVRPATTDVAHSITAVPADVLRMFNGWPATYGDIAAGCTFTREISNQIEADLAGDVPVAYVLGAAGVGKSTAARQALVRLTKRQIFCWEHKNDFSLSVEGWQRIASELKKRKQFGILFVDDCHWHLREINALLDFIGREENVSLRLLLVSTKHHWNPRAKSPIIFSLGKAYELHQLSGGEIESLLDLVGQVETIRQLVEDRFLGFSRHERRRRLIDRCGSDWFVCLRNIFGFERIDEIILREYAELGDNYQDIYRTVAAMEAAGVHVHRQLIVRTLGIPAEVIASVLDNLADIINEYTINERHGLYGWECRHDVIAEILTKHKYSGQEEIFNLFETIMNNLNPSYDIEVRTIRDICDIRSGIARISDRKKQNYLLRKLISIAPGERVPRHRLIYNLLEEGESEEAEREIRLFEKELGRDSPVLRYKIKLIVRRGEDATGIMEEDRASIIREAAVLAESGTRSFSNDKNVYRAYCEVGLAYFRVTGRWDVFDAAMEKSKEAEKTLLDPDLRRIIATFEGIARRIIRGAA